MPYTVSPAIDRALMTAHAQPTLVVDDQLTLRPFVDDDAADVFRAFADPDIQHWHAFRAEDLAEAHDWVERALTAWSDATSAQWAITDGDRFLGRCALHIDPKRGHAEIAYWVLPEARGRGVASHAAIAVTRWAHTDLGVHRVLLQHSVHNEASCAVANRAGYRLEGTARQLDRLVDGLHDMHQHAHLSTDVDDD